MSPLQPLVGVKYKFFFSAQGPNLIDITSLSCNVPLFYLLSPFSSYDLIDPFLDLNIQSTKLNLKPKILWWNMGF
jgi:hypothetical protein